MDFNNKQAVDIYAEKTELFPIEKKIFNEYLNNVGRVLDLGAGTGRTTSFIADLGNDVIGSDISPLMVERAQELHPRLLFKVQDACSLPYPQNVFDAVVFSFNGLDYIYPEDQRVKAMKEIYAVLKPGGVFIFSSHDLDGLKNWKRNWRRRPRSYKHYYKKELTVYGDLITYYGKWARTINTLLGVGFTNSKYYKLSGKTWRYYVTWA